MMSDFLAWFFGEHIYALPAWLPESYTKWTAMKLAEEPAPRHKYAARSHALALVRVPGRAPPRSGSGWAKESASAPACGAGTDCGEFGRPIVARAHGTGRAERAVPVRELGRPQDPPHAIAVEALRRRTPRGTPTPLQGAARSTARCVLRVRRDDGAFRGVRQQLRAKGLMETGTSVELVARLVEARRAADAAILAAPARAAE